MNGETTRCIRRARPEDVHAIAKVHVGAYHETYAEMLPREELLRMDIAFSSKLWRQVLSGTSLNASCGVEVAEHSGQIIGLGCCCAQRSPELSAIGYDAEVASIYVLRAFHGIGFGRWLMLGMAQQLRGSGFNAMALWAVRENVSATSFYQRLGGVALMEKEVECEGGPFIETAWGWNDIDALI